MSTIVLHKPTDKKYILVGAGYELSGNADYHEPLYGSLHGNMNSHTPEMAMVCDSMGRISFIHSSELIVLEIDGISPGNLLA